MAPTYDKIDDRPLIGFSAEQYFITVYNDNKKGLLDAQPKQIFSIAFNNNLIVYAEGKHFFMVSAEEKYGVYNSSLKPILPVKYEQIYFFMGRNRFLVQEYGKHGATDLDGNIVFKTEYDKIVQIGLKKLYHS